jgi:hypothetical protein
LARHTTTPTSTAVTTVTHTATGRTWEYMTSDAAQAVIWACEQNDYGHQGPIRYINPKTYNGYKRTASGHYCNGYVASVRRVA